MNVCLRQLRAFLAVAKYGSFSRAAEEVAVSQSAISFAVQQLESELGLRLLDRTTRQVRVTAVGETLAASGTRLLAELDISLTRVEGHRSITSRQGRDGLRSGAGARLVGIEVGVVSGVCNLESPGVEAPGWRLRHERAYHAA